ncbi:MAG: hypothetical protein K5930_12345 [Treponemataceae bacterium]|nr:hypothetical protein [Treponemataceae bacterium]
MTTILKLTESVEEFCLYENEKFTVILFLLLGAYTFADEYTYIEIKGDKIQIDNTEYSVILDVTFLEDKNVALYIVSEKRPYVLVKSGANGELHGLEQDKEGFLWNVDEKIIKEFPLMFVKADDEFPA